MAYYINGRRMTGAEAARYIAMEMVAAGALYSGALLVMVEDYLHSIQPGERREYARAWVSCEYAQ